MDACGNDVYVPTSDNDESDSEAFMYTQNVLQGNTTTQVTLRFVFEQSTTITNVESCSITDTSEVQSTSSDQDQIPIMQGSTLQPDYNELSSNDEFEIHSNNLPPSSPEPNESSDSDDETIISGVRYPMVNFNCDIDYEEDFEWDWVETDPGASYRPFTGTPGLRIFQMTNLQPKDFFNEMFQDQMYQLMADETNRYANNRIQGKN